MNLSDLENHKFCDKRSLIISLIFVAILGSVLCAVKGSLFAGSFLIGAAVATVDLYLLSRFIRKLFISKSSMTLFPLSLFRWFVVAIILYLVYLNFKFEPIPLIIGITIPFVCLYIINIYKIIMENKDGASF